MINIPPMAAPSTMFAPHQSSPLARTTSPFQDPRPPPCTPAKTAKLWDEYERRAVEKAKKRERTAKASHSQRSSASDISGTDGKGPLPTTTRSSFDFKFRRGHAATPSTTVSTCKTCKQPITYASGICERCQRTIILAPSGGETSAPISPPARSPASTEVPQRHRRSIEDSTMPVVTSPTQRSFCPLPSQLVDAPVRLDSLRRRQRQQQQQQQQPAPSRAMAEPARSRKASLTDPNEPFLRLQTTQQKTTYQPRAHSQSHPTTPTFLTNPSSAAPSRASTRPSSVANVGSLSPTCAYPYSRNNSATPSDLSTLLPYSSTATTCPPSAGRSSFALPNPTSAWDDWDSESEGEKVRRVGWIGRRKAKGKSTDKDSKGSIDSTSSEGDFFLRAKKGSKADEEEEEEEEDRLEQARLDMAERVRASRLSRDRPMQAALAKEAKERKEKKKKTRPSGFVRAISCGCRQ